MNNAQHKGEQKELEVFGSKEKRVVGNEVTKSGPKVVESARIIEKQHKRQAAPHS